MASASFPPRKFTNTNVETSPITEIITSNSTSVNPFWKSRSLILLNRRVVKRGNFPPPGDWRSHIKRFGLRTAAQVVARFQRYTVGLCGGKAVGWVFHVVGIAVAKIPAPGRPAGTVGRGPANRVSVFKLHHLPGVREQRAPAKVRGIWPRVNLGRESAASIHPDRCLVKIIPYFHSPIIGCVVRQSCGRVLFACGGSLPAVDINRTESRVVINLYLMRRLGIASVRVVKLPRKHYGGRSHGTIT